MRNYRGANATETLLTHAVFYGRSWRVLAVLH